jgi:hypothetical protein
MLRSNSMKETIGLMILGGCMTILLVPGCGI